MFQTLKVMMKMMNNDKFLIQQQMERKYGKNIVKRDNLTEHDENIKTTIEGYTKEKALVQKSNALRKLQLILRNEVSGIEVIENEYQC